MSLHTPCAVLHGRLQSACVVGSQLTPSSIHEGVRKPRRNAEAALKLLSKTYEGTATFSLHSSTTLFNKGHANVMSDN